MPATRRQRGSAVVEKPKRRILGALNDNCPDVPSHAQQRQKAKTLGPTLNPPKSKRPRLPVAVVNESENHTENGFRLVCRDSEISTICHAISECISNARSGSLYISGSPGTGKTAVVRYICAERLPSTCRSFYVNCMRVDEPGALAQAIMIELRGGNSVKGPMALESVEQYLTKQPPKKPIVLVLDEMDALAHKHQETLYRLFDWPAILPCRIILLCIANSLDLTDRLLPRLKGRTWRPTLLHFRPYSHEQLAQIVDSRLAAEKRNEPNEDSVGAISSPIDPRAIQLCARKVAASTGDARAALDICRRSVELAAASPSSPASLGHVSRALRDAAGSNVASSSAGMPLQQKLGLASAMLLDRREFSLGALHDKYTTVCRERHLQELDAAEFAGVCQLLEARGLLVIRRAKETRLHKLSLKLDEKSLRRAIDDQALIASVLRK